MINNIELIKTKKCGRPKITDKYITLEALLEVYRETRSMRKTAKRLGLAVHTVFTYVNGAHESGHVGQPFIADPLEQSNNRKIARDIDGLGQALPRSVAKIRKLLQNVYTLDQIQYFLRTRQQAAEQSIRKYGSLLDHADKTIRDIYGRNIPIGSIAQYVLSIDRYSLNVTIEATLKFGGKITSRTSFEFYKILLQNPVKCPPKLPEATETSV